VEVAMMSFDGIAIDAFDTIYISGNNNHNNFPLGSGASAATRLDAAYNAGTDANYCKIPRHRKKRGKPIHGWLLILVVRERI